MTMGNSRASRWVQNAVILIGVGVFALATFTGNNESRKTRETLEYNAVRGDCIRDVQGDYNRQLYADLADILNAGRDRDRFAVIVKRMEAKAKVNYADTVLQKCQPAVKGETTTTTTTTTTARSSTTAAPVTTTRRP